MSILQYLPLLDVMNAYTLLVVNIDISMTFLMDPSYYPDRKKSLFQQNDMTKQTKAMMELNEVLWTINNGWDTQVAEWPMDKPSVHKHS